MVADWDVGKLRAGTTEEARLDSVQHQEINFFSREYWEALGHNQLRI
jgi:hypothetical protein